MWIFFVAFIIIVIVVNAVRTELNSPENSNTKGGKMHLYVHPDVYDAYNQVLYDLSDTEKLFIIVAITLIGIDGRSSRQEWKVLLAFLYKQFGRDNYNIRGSYINYFKTHTYNIEKCCDILSRQNFLKKKAFLYGLFRISVSDGYYSESEDNILKTISQRLKIPNSEFEKIKSLIVHDRHLRQEEPESSNQNKNQYFNYLIDSNFKLEKAYSVFGLNANSSNDEIKKKWIQLAKEFHPDKYSYQSEILAKQAQEQFQIITEAYDLIKKDKNI